MSSSSNSPCAACKFLRRKCTQECVFAPYFPPDNPQREQQEMFRSYEHQQQQEFLRFSGGGFDMGSASSAGGFSQVSPAAASADQLSPSLALGSFDNAYHMQQPQQEEPHHHHHHPHHIPLEAQLLLPPQQKQQTHHESQLPLHQQHSDNEERRSVGPSC
ncbi:LOB domain-containing protein 36 [Glycine soja]|nr:LOB domain-containing protein 36 [Glycine soja]